MGKKDREKKLKRMGKQLQRMLTPMKKNLRKMQKGDSGKISGGRGLF